MQGMNLYIVVFMYELENPIFYGVVLTETPCIDKTTEVAHNKKWLANSTLMLLKTEGAYIVQVEWLLGWLNSL